MEVVRMSETKLSITKEQAEAFAKWQFEYDREIFLVNAVLRQELTPKGCENCKLYKTMKAMGGKVMSLTIAEGAAQIDGDDIKSDLELGFALSRYMTSIEEAFNGNNYTEQVLIDRMLERPREQLEEIFFGK